MPQQTPLYSEIAPLFSHFARFECDGEPLYEALCLIAADNESILSLMQFAPDEQRRPNLLLAAVHYLLLAGNPHPLGRYFPSVNSASLSNPISDTYLEINDELKPLFIDFCRQNKTELAALIGQKSTQTNEIGRSAVLWPTMHYVVEKMQNDKVALLDFGCSAGLNLGVDQYHYDYGDFTLGNLSVDAAKVQCEIRGNKSPIIGRTPHIVTRIGIDPAPNSVFNPQHLNWLRACLWPHDLMRRQRFDRAVQLAQNEKWSIIQADDCSQFVEAWCENIRPGIIPIVFNSWVLAYFNAESLQTHIQRMEQWVQKYGMVWISAEAPEYSVAKLSELKQTKLTDKKPEGTFWSVMRPGKQQVIREIVARSHAHGKWLEWLATDSTSSSI